MTKRLVIKNVPSRLPISLTLCIYLCMDKWNAPEWLYGVMAVLGIIVWIVIAIDIWNDVRIDIFQGANEKDPVKRQKVVSKFQARLEKMAEERAEKNE